MTSSSHEDPAPDASSPAGLPSGMPTAPVGVALPDVHAVKSHIGWALLSLDPGLVPRWARISIVSSIVAGVVVLLTLIYAFDPSAPTSRFPPCIFHALTGLECPGCGTTRGLHALLHGDVVTAWNFNPLMFFALPAVALLGLWEGARFVGVALPPLRAPRHTPWAILFVVVIFGVLRNVM